MKVRHFIIMSLIVICCLNWSVESRAAKFDPVVERAQRRLTQFGYDPGSIDGKMGEKTVAAIQNFQRDYELPVTGKLDEATLQKLGISPNVVRTQAHGTRFSIGGKLWYADADVPGYRGREVNIDPGINWGPILSVDFANDWRVSGMFLIGTYDYGSVVDYYHDWYERGGELSSQDGEITIERSFNILAIGGGFRYAAWKWEPTTGRGEKQDVTSYGPMISLGMEYAFRKIPIGGYLGASWLFIELGDQEDTEHLNFEGGLFFTIENLKGTFGYRYKNYYKLYENYVELDGDSLVFDGFVLSLSYIF